MRDKKSTTEEPNAVAEKAADALAAVSGGLESASEGAHATGLAVRDTGRDTAKAISRGETTLRNEGLLGAVAGLAVRAQRNAKTIALAGAGLATLLFVRHRSGAK